MLNYLMRTRAGTGAGLVLFILFSCVTPASWAAHQCSAPDVATWTADTAREARMCVADMANYEIKSCGKNVCKAVLAWREEPGQAKLDKALGIVMEIQASLRNETAPQGASADQLSREIDRWMADLKRAGRTISSQLQNQRWRLEPASLEILAPRPIKFGELIEQGCTKAPACTEALRGSAVLVLYSTLVKTVADGLLDDLRDAAVAHIDMLDQRWNTYLGASRFQYPWELAINSARFNTDGYGGFVSPPENQFIVLHPSIGMRYNKNATPKFEQTLVLEMLGYYRWHWNGVKAEDLLGGSLIMTWTNAAGEKKPGWGAILHLPKSLSVGLINHGTENGRKTSLLVSVDLAKLFENKAAVLEKYTKLTNQK